MEVSLNIRAHTILQILEAIGKRHRYAVLHHVDKIFDTNSDIDLAIECPKNIFLPLIKSVAADLNLYVCNIFNIDITTYRIDLLFINDLSGVELIELDCTLADTKNYVYGINSLKLLDDTIMKIYNEYNIYHLKRDSEINYYIRKQLHKNTNVDHYYDYLLMLNPSLTMQKIEHIQNSYKNYVHSFNYKMMKIWNSIQLLILRINAKPGTSIAILGPDGAGKSTLIQVLSEKNWFGKVAYFHLKPCANINSGQENSNPHSLQSYPLVLSYIKLIYLINVYCFGWLRNIVPLRLRYSFIIFDRYYHDLIIDPKRFRYGGSTKVAKLFSNLVPKPEVFFILITEPSIIMSRKDEVTSAELCKQISNYENLVDGKQFFRLDASKRPIDLAFDVLTILAKLKNAQY